jgi:RNA polymerase sigma-70 factor (ECF subfamily)
VAELYRRCHVRTYRVALAILRSPRLAEEANQEVWLKAVELYRPPGEALERQLLTIAKHTAVDILRREGRYRELPPDWDAPGGEEPEQTAAFRRVVAAIRALPADYRAVLELKFLGGLTNRAIARRLALKESTVATRVARGKEQLREALKKEGYDL